MKRFWAINVLEGKIAMEVASKTPREAALKVASRDESLICLADSDTGKLHVFRGERVPLTETEKTDFTRRRNIQVKPVVSKMAYKNLSVPLHRADTSRMVDEFRTMLD